MTNIVVSSGNTDVLFDLSAGDTMLVLSGGAAQGTTVSSGGREIVSSGGRSLGDTVLSGGVEVIFSGAVASNVTISTGGTLSGAGTLSAVTDDFGLVVGGAVVSGATGFSSITVENHGVASSVTIDDSFATILSGGTTRNLRVTGGGLVSVSAGGTTTGTVFASAGGAEDVSGAVRGTVLGHAVTEFIFSGGVAVGTIVSSGAIQLVSSGGLASGGVLLGGGTQSAENGGSAKGTVISSGGAEDVLAGGVALSSFIGSGGEEVVSSGGVASVFTIFSGGGLTVEGGGLARLSAGGNSTNFGFIDLKATAGMDLAGTLDNGGTIVLENSNIIEIATAKATLTGSGLIDMASADEIIGLKASDVLDNEDNTIEGTGQLGGENLTLINRGTINANQNGNDLTLNATLVTNTGLIEATNAGGGLAVFGPINNSGGVIEAKGGDVFLQPSTTISGGVLSGTGEGEFFGENSVGLDGSGQVLTNEAVIFDVDGATLTLDGAIKNAGVISLGGAGDHTDLAIDGASVTLTGSGLVLLSEDTSNRILGDATTFTNVLDNVDNTIEGAGEIGAGKLILVNSGAIDATSKSVSLEIDTTSATNAGLMESTAAGGLVIVTSVNNSGGVIAANLGDVFLEAGAQILGGLLTSTPLAHIFVANTTTSAVTLNGVASPLTNNSNIFVSDTSELDLVGAIVNSGVIALNAAGDFTDLTVNGTSATLTGGGVIELSDNADNRILGAAAADKLINVNDTIEGSGEVGASQLTLVNSGTIDATGAAASLVLNASTTTNTGLIEATNTAGLLIQGVVRNSSGVIAAKGGNIILEAGAVISGGLLSATAAGNFIVTDTTAKLVGATASPLTNAATIYIEDTAQLSLAGAIVNNGIVSLNATADTTTLLAAANVTLTGNGRVELTNSNANRITGAASTVVFDNESNTIEGGGEIGGGELTLINRGTIDATGTTASLRVDATSATNTGLMESTNAGGLLIEDTIKNSGGVIEANDGAVFLNVATISGGVLSSNRSGVIYDLGVVTFDGTASQLSNKAVVSIDDGVQLFLGGLIANTGRIVLDGAVDNTDLVINTASVTLTGSGTIELTDNADNRIFGSAGADVLNNETNTIEGAGQIGVGQLTLFNGGTIDASGATNTLVIDTLSATNSGLIEATTAPGLVIESVIQNAGGVIGAFGGDVFIEANGGVSGGVFSGQGGGKDLIEVVSGGQVVGASVGAGADELVFSGATQRNVSVLANGVVEVSSGATASGSVVLSGGQEIVSSGGVALGATISAGGSLIGPGTLGQAINDRGVVSGELLKSGGVATVFSGGLTQNLRIAKGGKEVLSGGVAGSSIVNSGGSLTVLVGGTAAGTRLHTGATETISSGGISVLTVMSGGSELDFGRASGTVLLSGAKETVEALGSASGSVISKGGQQVVSSGGVTVAATLFASGALIVSSGGSVSGGLTINAGSATIDGTMAAGQTVNFAGVNGALKLDNLAAFHAKISGLSVAGQKIDLGGFAFSAGETVTWTQSGTSGTLSVHDGAKSASLTLVGAYVTGQFTLAADGHGGTFISDPPLAPDAVAAPAATRFTQAAAGFGGAKGGGAVHAGGSAFAGPPPMLTAAMSGR